MPKRSSTFEIVSFLTPDEYFDLGMALLIQQETFEKGIGLICNAYAKCECLETKIKFSETLSDFFDIDEQKSNGFVIEQTKIYLHHRESMSWINIAHLNSWDNLYNYIQALK